MSVSKEVMEDKTNYSRNCLLLKERSMPDILYSVLKKISVVGAIYFVGYMGWSAAWFITPIIFSILRDQWQISSENKRSLGIASALSNEKDVILARITDLPAWVYFPDVERCEWLNKILLQLWPNVNCYAKDLVHNVIEPNISKALENYKLKGFKFDRIILGTVPPRIGGVKVYDKNIARNEIILDLDLMYISDCDINFKVAGIRGGLKHFQLNGMIRVIMKPLITTIPLVGGLQIFFLNKPSIDFNLVGIVDVLDMPGLSDMLRKIIIEQISSIMVLPNKLPIVLSDEVAATSLKMPKPEGILRIHLVEAKNLMKKDISVLGKGKSDPYAVITIGNQEFRTKTINNTVDPKWDYWCEAVLMIENGQNIEIELMDSDDTSDDEKLGRVTIEINKAVSEGSDDTWFTLEDVKHGMVHIRLTWMNLSNNLNDLQTVLEETRLLQMTSLNSALLVVFVDSASNLPHARSPNKPDPFVIITLNKQVNQTAVQMRTDAPVWEQGFTYLVHNPYNDVLHLSIEDKKTGKGLGNFSYILNSLLEKKNMEIISEPFQLHSSGSDSKITLFLQLYILKKSSNTMANDEIFDMEKLENPKHAEIDFCPKVIEKEMYSLEDQAKTLDPKNSHDTDSNIVKRTPSVTSSAGICGLGRIQITLRYSTQRQRLVVIIHKIMNIPLKDPSNVPDPYVKLYLLPGRSRESKRKTSVIKDNCNPVFDVTFEYIISTAELLVTALEVTVSTQKGFFSGGSPVVGMVRLQLNEPEISQQGLTTWHDLLAEHEFD